MPRPKPIVSVDATTLYAIASEIPCDPRTVARVLEGKRAQRRHHDAIVQALAKRGYEVTESISVTKRLTR